MSDIFGFGDILEGAESTTGDDFTGEQQFMNNELANEPACDDEKNSLYGKQTNDDEIIADFFGDEENVPAPDYEQAGKIPVSGYEESINDTQNQPEDTASETQEVSHDTLETDEKPSARGVLSSGKKPLKLNRQLIFTVMGILFLAVFSIFIFFTSFRKKPEEKKTIAKASERYVPDFPCRKEMQKIQNKTLHFLKRLPKRTPLIIQAPITTRSLPPIPNKTPIKERQAAAQPNRSGLIHAITQFKNQYKGLKA